MDDFYITLPSSVKNPQFDNTSSRYVTHLPEVLQLERDKYVVAVTDIIYPYSFVNVGRPLNYWIHFKNRGPVHVTLPSAQYSNISHVVDTLNDVPRPRTKRGAPIDLEPEYVAAKRWNGPSNDDDDEKEHLVDQVNKILAEKRKMDQEQIDNVQRVFEKKRVKRNVSPPKENGQKPTLIGEFYKVSDGQVKIKENKQKSVNREISEHNNVEDGTIEQRNRRKKLNQGLIDEFVIVENAQLAGKEENENTTTPAPVTIPPPTTTPAPTTPMPIIEEDEEETSLENTSTPAPVTIPPPSPFIEKDEDAVVVPTNVRIAPKTSRSLPIYETPKTSVELVQVLVKQPAELVHSDEVEQFDQNDQQIIDEYNRHSLRQSQQLIDSYQIAKQGKDQVITSFEIVKQGQDQNFINEVLQKQKEDTENKLDSINFFKDSEQREQAAVKAEKEYRKALLAVYNKPKDRNSYDDAKQNFERIRAQLSVKEEKSSKKFLKFKEEDDKIHVQFLNSDILFVEFETSCAYFLGFHDNFVRKSRTAPSKVDFFGNVSTLYLYCDIVDPIIVGDQKNPLMSVIPCKGKFGEMIHHPIPYPRYLPIMNNTIDSIKVELLSEFAEPINFNWGSTIITLHFKKIQ